jgi:hypothetical protein
MTHDDLTEDELTMLAKCEAARCLDTGEKISRTVAQLAYPTVSSHKRFSLLSELKRLGLIEHTTGYRSTDKGRTVLKQLEK